MRTRYVLYGVLCVMRCGDAGRRWGVGDWIVGISAGGAKMPRPIPINLNMPRARLTLTRFWLMVTEVQQVLPK